MHTVFTLIAGWFGRMLMVRFGLDRSSGTGLEGAAALMFFVGLVGIVITLLAFGH